MEVYYGNDLQTRKRKVDQILQKRRAYKRNFRERQKNGRQDTIKVSANGSKIIVRLVGIDAPETSKKKNEPGQPYSKKSTKHLAGLVLNKYVTVKSYSADRYGRTLGVVFVNGQNVNIEMVKIGLAEVYRGKPAKGLDMNPYVDAEAGAKKAGIGMWSLGDNYISPKQWRKMHRK